VKPGVTTAPLLKALKGLKKYFPKQSYSAPSELQKVIAFSPPVSP